MLLDGKTALVTGGVSGLGLETARLFTEHGANVVVSDIADHKAAAALETIGGDARFIHADVRDTAEMNAAVAAAEEAFGALHLVVANAGVLGRSSFLRIADIDDDAWEETIAVNLSGTFRTFRAAVPALRRAGGGAMSATSSTSGAFATAHRLAYSASKGAINAMVRGLSIELAPDRIRVNGICPGAMKTDIRASLGRTREEIDVPLPDPAFKPEVKRPDRDGTAEAARVHLFLCSELSEYITGESLIVDGGFSIWNGS